MGHDRFDAGGDTLLYYWTGDWTLLCPSCVPIGLLALPKICVLAFRGSPCVAEAVPSKLGPIYFNFQARGYLMPQMQECM
jgi:hypothetical protein